ncbi:MAG: hypothetical protein LC114_01640, partial [Bryobacterales bacterium]|nr:hypothetical protein [Bryobacterales bacterium]
MRWVGLWILIAVCSATAFAQQRERPGLFFREDWVESPSHLPVTQQDVANPALILSLHGPG